MPASTNVDYYIVRYNLMKKTLNDSLKDNLDLHNKLTIERIKSKENLRYLAAYQHLYVREVLRNERTATTEPTLPRTTR